MLSETFYKLWDAGILQRGVWETIYMTVISTAIAYALGQGATLVSVSVCDGADEGDAKLEDAAAAAQDNVTTQNTEGENT